MSEHLNVKDDEETFDDWILKDTRLMVHQGLLDKCEDFFVSIADLEET